MKMNAAAWNEGREELRAAFEQAFYNALVKIGEKALELDWFPKEQVEQDQKQAA